MSWYSKSWFYVCALPLIAVATAGCTRKMPDPAHLRLQLPNSTMSTMTKVTTLAGTTSGWALPDPTDINQIICYAVLIEGPEPAMQSRVCTDTNSNVIIKPGIMAGAFVAGSLITLDVPSGPARKIALVGFAATSSSTCQNFDSTGGPDRNNMSAPLIISQVVMDLNPGTVDVNMFASLNGAQKFDSCTNLGSPDQPTGSGLLISDVNVNEGGSAQLAVNLNVSLASPVTVSYSSGGGNATAGTDYASVSGQLSFAPGQMVAYIPVGSFGDATFEGNEYYTVSLFASSGASIVDGMGVVAIQEASPVPIVNISNATASEGGTVVFQVSISNPAAMPIGFNVAVIPGTAANTDYVNPPTYLSVAPGQTFTQVQVATNQDNLFENNEIFTVSLGGFMFSTGGAVVATGVIINDDPTPQVGINDITAIEGSPLVFTVSLVGDTSLPSVVDFGVMPGSAQPGADFTAIAGSLTFAAGVHQLTVTAPGISDTTHESNETFMVSLSNPQNCLLSKDIGVGTINDNDPIPAVFIADSTVTEGQSAIFNISLSGPTDVPTTFNFTTNAMTAQTSLDFLYTNSVISLAPGATTASVVVPTVQDAQHESYETFSVSLSALNGLVAGDLNAIGTITDDDAVPSLAISDLALSEGSTFYFNVSLSSPNGMLTTLNYNVVSGTALSGADFTVASGQLTIPAGSSSSVIQVASIDDSVYENSETFMVTLSGLVNATFADAVAIGTINDNDAMPTLSMASVSATEGAPIVVPISLFPASSLPVSFAYQTYDGTATLTGDYLFRSGVITIAPGITTASISIPTVQDVIAEPTEYFSVSISSVTGASSGLTFVQQTILDNDLPPIYVSDLNLTEGASAVVLVVSLAAPAPSPISFTYQAINGTALAGVDFISIAGGGNISTGALSFVIPINTIDDASAEGTETFTISISGVTGANPAKPSGLVTIDDNDSAPGISVNDYTAVEGSAFLFTVSLSSLSASPVTMNFTTMGGAATPGVDYVSKSGVLTISANTWATSFSVSTIDDASSESMEPFYVSLSSPVNATFIDNLAIGFINDDDAAGALFVSDASAVEGSTLVFTVSLSAPSGTPVSFNFQTFDSTATTADADYVPYMGAATLSPGQTIATFFVVTNQDAKYEANELFGVSLTSLVNASAGDIEGVGTINDDDGIPNMMISDASVVEGGTLVFLVSIDRLSGFDTTAWWSTSDGTATAPADYGLLAGLLTIPQGSLVTTVQVPTVQDVLTESPETIIVSLPWATDAVVAGSIGQGTIVDDDGAGAPEIIIMDARGVEGSTLMFGITLSASSGSPVTFDYFTVAQTASSGADFGVASGTISLAPGQTMASFSVVTYGDLIVEDPEAFMISITNLTNATVSLAGKGTILDDDGWVATEVFKPVNNDQFINYGSSVFFEGNYVAIGAPNESSSSTSIINGTTASTDHSAAGAGAAYVYERVGGTWGQVAYVKAANAEANDFFGQSVALVNNHLAVGAAQESSNQTMITNGPGVSADNSAATSGAVYVYARNGSTWSQEAYIKAANAGAGDQFGWSLSLGFDTLVVGAYYEDSNQTVITNGTSASTNNSLSDAGAAYVYRRNGTTWTQEAYLKAANAHLGDNFGASVAISEDTIAIASPSEDSGQTFVTNGPTAAGDTAAVNAGAVYVFRRTGTTWAEEAYLKAANAGAGDNYGSDVKIDYDTIIVGAPGEDSNQTTVTNGSTASADNSLSSAGAAYVYQRSGASWAEVAYLKAPNASATDYYGTSVAISGDRVAVSAPYEDSASTFIYYSTAAMDNNASDSGAVYVYKRLSNSSWTLDSYLKPANAGAGDNFGMAVSLKGDFVFVGSPNEDGAGTAVTPPSYNPNDNGSLDSGAVYSFMYQGACSVIIQQAANQADPAGTYPVNFMVKFSQPIDIPSFIPSDIVQSGTATGVTWTLTQIDSMTFQLQATSGSASGTLVPTIAAGTVNAQYTGKQCQASSVHFDNSVTY